MSYNKIILIGRLVADPEMGETPKKIKFAKFSIATEDSVKSKGEWVKEVTYHNITLWNKSAEYAQKHLHKGEGLIIEGKQKNDNYETNEGVKKTHSHVVVSSFKKQFLAVGSSASEATDVYQIVEDNEDNL